MNAALSITGADLVRALSEAAAPRFDAAVRERAEQVAREAGGEDAYFGDPTAASAEDGDTYFEGWAEILALSVMEHLGSKA